MAEKIIKIWLLTPREHYKLSEEEMRVNFEKIAKKDRELGVKALIPLSMCWSDDQWSYFGAQEFPNLEAVRKHQEYVLELGLPMLHERKSFLGSPVPLGPMITSKDAV